MIAALFVLVHYAFSVLSWTDDQISQSRWWLSLPLAKRHLLSGVPTTGVGALWLWVALRDFELSRNLRGVLYAAVLMLIGLYELLEAALLS